MDNHPGYQILYDRLKQYASLSIAFSGGVDSTFLLKVASDALPGKVAALTVSTPYTPQWEIKEASELAALLRVPHYIFKADIPPAVADNPPERCYLCKKTLFSLLTREAEKLGYVPLADGTNADDIFDDRPGRKALHELNVQSPLLEAGLGKEEIRMLSEKMGLPTAHKPAYSCLLTRIPYNTRITEGMLRTIEAAEQHLHEAGFWEVRVRHHGDIARIELPPETIPLLVSPDKRNQIILDLKKLGFRYVTLDLEGYNKPRPAKQNQG